MLNLNKVMLCGRLTADPEVGVAKSGTAYARFTIAVNRRNNEEADFIRCLAWSGTAAFMQNYFKKGMAIYVEGALQTGSYTDKEGKKRYTTEVVVRGVSFVEPKKKDEPAEANEYGPDYEEVSVQPKFEELQTDDDLPF